MKVLNNTLKSVISKWTDPGDYPSNAGGGPLPSHDFVEEINGEVIIELEQDDIDGHDDVLGDLDLLNIDLPFGVSQITEWKWDWNGKMVGGRITFIPIEWEDDLS